LELQICKPQGS